MAVCLSLALLACRESSEPKTDSAREPSTPTPAPSGTPEAPATASGKHSAVTGAIDEQAFKQLHDLKTEPAPAARGALVNLPGGSTAYLSVPAGAAAPLPAVVVIHEWWGLNEHIKHWTDRLSADGYAALAVDLFGGKVATNGEEAMALMKAVDDARARATLLDALAFLKDDPRVRASRRGSIGWCFGGKWSLNLALAAPDLDAAVVYYGHVTTDPKELEKIQAPVLAIFGERDASIPMEHVKKFDAALTTAKVDHRVLTYPAEHAFANPSGARYDEQAAEAAWGETRAFLAKRLKAAP